MLSVTSSLVFRKSLVTVWCVVRAETDIMDESLPEEILLDENAEAEKHSFYMVGSFEVSPDQQLLAWAEDIVGGECGSMAPYPQAD
jgi:protease II